MNGADQNKAENQEPFPQPRRKDGGEPCSECHIQPGETCDICGAVNPAPQTRAMGTAPVDNSVDSGEKE